MHIIKEGKKPDYSKRFTCDLCGCVFIAEKSEYAIVQIDYNESGYECECPTCGALVRRGVDDLRR